MFYNNKKTKKDCNYKQIFISIKIYTFNSSKYLFIINIFSFEFLCPYNNYVYIQNNLALFN